MGVSVIHCCPKNLTPWVSVEIAPPITWCASSSADSVTFNFLLDPGESESAFKEVLIVEKTGSDSLCWWQKVSRNSKVSSWVQTIDGKILKKKQNVNVRKVWAHTTLETGTGESNIFRNMIYQYQLNPIASLSFIEPPCLLSPTCLSFDCTNSLLF